MSSRRAGRLLALVSLLAATACASAPRTAAPLLGEWGGRHVGLVLSTSGGTLDYDCAAGRIDGPVVPGRDGRFVAEGSHSPGHGGPERIGEQHPSYRALYSGTVRGGTMMLEIDVPERGFRIGPYRLERGAQPLLMRCL